MREFVGKYNKAQVMTDEIDETTEAQIRSFLDHPAFAKTYIVVMPDCHAGAGVVIGFTAKLNDYVIPNVVGVDIGCGVDAYNLGPIDIDFGKLDLFIRENIPSGFSHRQDFPYPLENDSRLARVCENIGEGHKKVQGQMGTLGGGNHFIEVDFHKESGDHWLVIHSGSRNFGLKVAKYHQDKAKALAQRMLIASEQYKGLEYLPMEVGGREYLEDMQVAQTFAGRNRAYMARIMLCDFFMRSVPHEVVSSVHNYISFDDLIIRKGAIQAYEGQRVIIPFNMRDGVAIGNGKSSKRWNFSAPHGAGRVMSRSQAKRTLSMSDFTAQMKGVYTTTATEKTLDEAPDTYKRMELILEAIEPTVEVEFLMKPVYNFKAVE